MKPVKMNYSVKRISTLITEVALELYKDDQVLVKYVCRADTEVESIKVYNSKGTFKYTLTDTNSGYNSDFDSAIALIFFDIKKHSYLINNLNTLSISDNDLWNPKGESL